MKPDPLKAHFARLIEANGKEMEVWIAEPAPEIRLPVSPKLIGAFGSSRKPQTRRFIRTAMDGPVAIYVESTGSEEAVCVS